LFFEIEMGTSAWKSRSAAAPTWDRVLARVTRTIGGQS